MEIYISREHHTRIDRVSQLLMHRTKWFMAIHIEKDTDR